MEIEKPTIIIKKIQKIIKSRNFLYWKNKFSKEKNVCCTPIENIENLFKDSHLVKKKLLPRKDKKGNFILKIPTVIDNKPLIIKEKLKVPLLAEHNYIINE